MQTPKPTPTTFPKLSATRKKHLLNTNSSTTFRPIRPKNPSIIPFFAQLDSEAFLLVVYPTEKGVWGTQSGTFVFRIQLNWHYDGESFLDVLFGPLIATWETGKNGLLVDTVPALSPFFYNFSTSKGFVGIFVVRKSAVIYKFFWPQNLSQDSWRAW